MEVQTMWDRLMRTAAEAEQAMFASGTAPVPSLIVNASKHASVAAFLHAAAGSDLTTTPVGDHEVRRGDVTIARVTIGTGISLEQIGGWDNINAIVMGSDFNALRALISKRSADSNV